MGFRSSFPTKTDAIDGGGQSDGYCFSTEFAGGTFERSYQMLKDFLKGEGYEDLPLPVDANELSLFKIPNRNGQIMLFEDSGYVHNPIKILFPSGRNNRCKLILKLYNESDPLHLLKFHKKINYD